MNAHVSRVFAITTRGLEPVSADELATIPGVKVEQIAYRRVFAVCGGALRPLLGLRTAEDIFLYAATWSGIGRARSSLETLTTLSTQLPLEQIARTIAQVRPLPKSPIFSVTANFVGRRNFNTEEIKQACAKGIASGQGWTYSEDDGAASLNLRVFIEGEAAVVGIRLGERSLSKRAYKHSHVPGSLRPTVAAALASLIGVQPGMRVLDPCCGAGTILIETQAYQAEVWGGDIDPEAVVAARQNVEEAGTTIRLQRWNSVELPVADRSIDRVISNLPWGRAVRTAETLETLYTRIGQEIARVLAPNGQAALLTNQPELVRIPGFECEKRIEISLFGQTPTILIWRNPKWAQVFPVLIGSSPSR